MGTKETNVYMDLAKKRIFPPPFLKKRTQRQRKHFFSLSFFFSPMFSPFRISRAKLIREGKKEKKKIERMKKIEPAVFSKSQMFFQNDKLVSNSVRVRQF